MGREKVTFQLADSTIWLQTIRELAEVIWHQHYPGIISHEQIRYMLDEGYSVSKLSQDIQEGTHIYTALHDAEPFGFIAFGPVGKECNTKLHKLYTLQSFHGMGIGSMLLAFVEQQCRNAECRDIHLFVNKHNAIAIKAYERAGYSIRESTITDIGRGFVMDDYVMGKSLED